MVAKINNSITPRFRLCPSSGLTAQTVPLNLGGQLRTVARLDRGTSETGGDKRIKNTSILEKSESGKNIIICTVLFLLLFAFVNLKAQQRPNIIFIMTDDQSSIPIAEANVSQSRPFGFNGDKHVLTPIIDSLAAGGIVFRNAYVSSSVCSPSRYTILTGRYGGRCEGTAFMKAHPEGSMTRVENNTELEDNRQNLPRLLQQAGYYTGFVGKSHVVDHHLLNSPKTGINGFMGYGQTDDPKIPEVSAKMEYNHNLWVERIKEFGFDYANGIYAANLKELHNDDLNVHNVEWKNKAALEFIDKAGDNPFYLYYSETIPHGPAPWNSPGGKYKYSIDADPGFTSAGYVLPEYDYLPGRQDILNEVKSADKDEKHAWLRWFDHAVGAIVEKLKEKGKLENTLIVITSDHGNYNHGKASIYEGGVKVPLAMYWPAGIQAGLEYNELVQNIDYVPTFLDLAGINMNEIEELDGVSLKNTFQGNAEAVHEKLFFELGYARGVMTKDWKYITVRYDSITEQKIENGDTFNGYDGAILSSPYYTRNGHLGHFSSRDNPHYFERDQLFNIKNDPTEKVNLFETNPEQLQEMKKLLIESLETFPNRPYPLSITDSLNTAVNYNKTISAIHVYPNPSEGVFEIKVSADFINESFKVYNSSGTLIKEGAISGNKGQLVLSDLTSGLYFLQIANKTIKIILK